jgi:hypothetical protein
METQKTLVTKVVGNGKMHITAKKLGQDSKVCYRTCTNLAQLGRKPSEVLLGGIFLKSFSMKYWYAMFGIFPRYYITYHDSMHWFSIF